MTGTANPKVFANGINGATGQYDRVPIGIEELARACAARIRSQLRRRT